LYLNFFHKEIAMLATWEQFEGLAQQVREGNTHAAERLRQELEPCLEIMVTRALIAQSTALPLTRWIRAQARQVRVPVGCPPAEARARLIAVLVRRSRDWVVEQLQAGFRSTQVLPETLCA
jgi:dihydrodipicolinate synthase/N-acetylneuraminate lyase